MSVREAGLKEPREWNSEPGEGTEIGEGRQEKDPEKDADVTERIHVSIQKEAERIRGRKITG